MTTAYPHTDSQPLERLAYWISEREAIRKRKAQGKKPYTTDPILRTYRFCNVRREDDRVTRWITTNWRTPNEYDSAVWHAMLIARFINWPPTLKECGYPEPWVHRRQKFAERLIRWDTIGQQVFTGAYIVSTNGAKVGKVQHVLGLFQRAYEEIGGRMPLVSTCQEAYAVLRTVNGIGSFMAAQIVADVKYTPLLKEAPDWYTFVAPGPGSLRGLNRVRGHGLQSTWTANGFAAALRDLKTELTRTVSWVAKLHLQDLQNCLCEFDKYERVLHGQGKPRSQYRPSLDPLP